jgi:hypothetical protein
MGGQPVEKLKSEVLAFVSEALLTAQEPVEKSFQRVFQNQEPKQGMKHSNREAR